MLEKEAELLLDCNPKLASFPNTFLVGLLRFEVDAVSVRYIDDLIHFE
jgi:hypothetical protein